MYARSMKNSDKLSTLDGLEYQPRNVAKTFLRTEQKSEQANQEAHWLQYPVGYPVED